MRGLIELVNVRFTTNRHIPHFHLQFVSQDNTHLLPSLNQKSPYQGFWRSEVHFRRLQIRVVSQREVCVHSDGLGSCLFVRLCIFTECRGSFSYFFLYISFA